MVKATDPTEWGNLIRSADEYPGTDASQTGWGDFTFSNYTYRAQDISDWETSKDPSHGPAAVQPDDIDIASDTLSATPGGDTSVQFAFYNNGTAATDACDINRTDDVVAFRLWLDGDPHFKTGYKSRHWNILLDVDGDGYKEFWLDLSGDYSQNSPDVLQLFYDNEDRQDIPKGTDPDYVFTADSISGSTDSFVRYGSQARGAEGAGLDYYIDMQIPVKYLDLADNGSEDCSISSATPLGIFYSTSASNTNPLQKDWMMDPNGEAISWTPDQTITFGDTITFDPSAGGAFSLTPLAYNETVGPGTVLNFAHVVKDVSDDAVSATYTFGASVQSGTCGTVTIYEDNDQNGVVSSGDTVLSSKSLADGATVYFVVEATASSGSCQLDVSVGDGTDTKTADDDFTVSQTQSAVKINELMYDPATGNEWLELTNTSQYFSADVDGWVISDNDGNTYTITDTIDAMPSATQCGGDEARIIVVFGGDTANNETNWSDCVVTLYTGVAGDWFNEDADDVSLCTGACSSTTIVDYVAYGGDAGAGDDNAVTAGIWTTQTYAEDVPQGHSLSRLRTADLRDGCDTNKYTDWYDANAPSPGEENTPSIVVNEVEFDGSKVDWAELYVAEDGVAGSAGVDISGYVLTDLDDTYTAFASSTTTVFNGDYVRIHWQNGDLGTTGTDETDNYCLTSDCSDYLDLYYGSTVTATNVISDDQLSLVTATSGGQYVDAVLWDGTAGNDVDSWCAACGDGDTDEGADATTLAGYTVNGISVPMWDSADAQYAVSGNTETDGTTIGRDAVSTDTLNVTTPSATDSASNNWDDTGGKDAIGETPGARNVGVIINEVMFDPISGNEWVELYCGSEVSDFSATPYVLTNGGSTTINSGSCTAGGYVTITVGTLITTSDAINLCSGTTTPCTTATIKDFVAYGADPGSADDTAVAAGIWTAGDYVSIGGISEGETIGRDKDQTETNRSLDWETHGGADAVGPTPAARNIGSNVLINEVMYDPSTGYEWIELYNPTSSAISMTGYVIQDGDSFTIPQYDTDGDGSVDDDLEIPAGEYLVIYLDDGGSAGSDDYSWDDGDFAELHADIAANSLDATDQISVCSTTCSSGTIVDFIAWGADPGGADDAAVAAGIWDNGDYINTSAVSTGESIGRDKDSTDLNQPADWADHGGPDAIGTTQGERNIGRVIINEISYKNGTADWIELYNPTDTALDLDSFCLSLDDGGTCYSFPDGLQRIPSDEYLIIRFFTNGADDLSWSDGDIATILAGGTYGSLSDTSAAISLYNSDTPGSTTIVDFVAYGAAPGTTDNTSGSGYDAITADIWDTDDFVNEDVDPNETIGRDKNSTDTNQPADWDDTGGPDAQQATYGYQNLTTIFAPGPTAITLIWLTAHSGAETSAVPPLVAVGLLVVGVAGLVGLVARRRKV